MEFENRNNSTSPRILRLEYNNLYIYYLEIFYGCSCNYIGCDAMTLHDKKLKVRDKNGNLIRTKNDKSYVRIPYSLKMTEEKAIEIYKENY